MTVLRTCDLCQRPITRDHEAVTLTMAGGVVEMDERIEVARVIGHFHDGHGERGCWDRMLAAIELTQECAAVQAERDTLSGQGVTARRRRHTHADEAGQ